MLGGANQGTVEDFFPGQGEKVSVDTEPQLYHRRFIQAADNSGNPQPRVIFVVFGAEPGAHGTVRMQIEHHMGATFIDDLIPFFFLGWDIKIVAGAPGYGDIMLLRGIGKEHI